MKKPINLFVALIITAATIAVSYGTFTHQFKYPEMPKDDPMFLDEVVEVIPEEAEANLETIQVISPVPLIRTTEYVNLTFEEMELLEEIAMAEAKGEGSKGMAFVMRVVLNRSLNDGMSIRDVIYKPGQFYTAGMEPGSDECHEALAMVMDGWDESQGALFFNTGGYRQGKEPLFQYGNHYFTK